MRKITLTTLAAAATGIMPAAAQQLPNADFAKWVDCIPWTSNGNEKAQGTTPDDWTISNVIGIGGLGATSTGEKAEGIDGGNAVMVKNSPNSLLNTQTVPGYFTLGTTWSTSVMGAQNDGGTFGGIELATRPDGVHFAFKRSVAEGSEQTATVVAYLWKGTFTQAGVPGNIIMAGEPVAVDMVNRDRNILGMETAKGGEVTKSEGAALVAKVVRPIAEVADEWTNLTVPFEYESEEAPRDAQHHLCRQRLFRCRQDRSGQHSHRGRFPSSCIGRSSRPLRSAAKPSPDSTMPSTPTMLPNFPLSTK